MEINGNGIEIKNHIQNLLLKLLAVSAVIHGHDNSAVMTGTINKIFIADN